LVELVALRARVPEFERATGQNALAFEQYADADAIVTNPPYERKAMQALIWHFMRILPTWLLLYMDWASTEQAAPFMRSCSDIVPVGRLRWIEGTTMSSMENFAWYRFDAPHVAGPIFHARDSAPVLSRVNLCAQCGKPYRSQRSDSKVCSDACRQRAYRERLSVTQPQRNDAPGFLRGAGIQEWLERERMKIRRESGE
jgi:hypothetical protein